MDVAAPPGRVHSRTELSDEECGGGDDAPLSTTPSSSESGSSILARRIPPRLPLKRTFRAELLERFSGWSSPARKRLKSSPEASPEKCALAYEGPPAAPPGPRLHWGLLLARRAPSVDASPCRSEGSESPRDDYKFWGRAERVANAPTATPSTSTSTPESLPGAFPRDVPAVPAVPVQASGDTVIDACGEGAEDVLCVLVETPLPSEREADRDIPSGDEDTLRTACLDVAEESPMLEVVTEPTSPVAVEDDGSVLQLLVLTPREERRAHQPHLGHLSQRGLGAGSGSSKPLTWKKYLCSFLARFTPPYFIFLVGLVQVSLFATAPRTVVRLLLWDSRLLASQPWRVVSYCLLHSGQMHLLLNVGVQTLVAAPLEAEQGALRVAGVYLGGAVAGSLGTAVVSPGLQMVGASAGVYALLISHIAHIILSADALRYRRTRLCAVLLLAGADAAYTAHHALRRGNSAPRIGVSAHCCGAASGLLLGLSLFRANDALPRHLVRGARTASVGVILAGTAGALAWTL